MPCFALVVVHAVMRFCSVIDIELHPYFVTYLPIQLLECVRIWGGISLFRGYDPMVRKEKYSLLSAPREIGSNVSNKILSNSSFVRTLPFETIHLVQFRKRF